MARRIITYPFGQNCIFCDKFVHYWPNCSATTAADYYDCGYTVTKRKTKIWFHPSCLKKNIRGTAESPQTDGR